MNTLESQYSHKKHASWAGWLIGATLAMALGPSVSVAQSQPAAAADKQGGTVQQADAKDATNSMDMVVGKTAIISTEKLYKRLSVAQPEIADVNAIGPHSVLVTAKKVGSTQVIVWDDQDHAQVHDISVTMDLSQLQNQLKRLFPDSSIRVEGSNDSIILRGRAPSALVSEQAAMVAAPYGKVLNFIEISGGQQVMLQVRFAEVSRSATSSLGVNLGLSDSQNAWGSNIGQVNPFDVMGGQLRPASVTPSVTLFGTMGFEGMNLSGFIDALRQNNLLRMLAEPNLIASSGQEASFLAGGEFPVPVAQSGSGDSPAITVEYREFGVKLQFTPVVMGDGRIRLTVAPEVSDLDFTTAVRFNGFVIPGLSSRKVSTTIELNEGQTFAIAGLLNNTVSASKDVTPLLGDLPVVGALFRSVRYQRKETELVVLVTPRLVEGMNPGQVPTLPGEIWRHPTDAQLFGNQDLGGPAADERHVPTTRPAQRYQGEHGFTPVTAVQADVEQQ